jgi:hypothetical protein
MLTPYQRRRRAEIRREAKARGAPQPGAVYVILFERWLRVVVRRDRDFLRERRKPAGHKQGPSRRTSGMS